MKRILLVALIAVSLGGCARLQASWNALTTSQVDATTVIVAANTFNALEATATNYLSLPRCTSTGKPVVCRSPAATAKIIPAVRAGRVARNNLEQFLADHPGQIGAKGLYDALVSANTTLQGIFAQYYVGK